MTQKIHGTRIERVELLDHATNQLFELAVKPDVFTRHAPQVSKTNDVYTQAGNLLSFPTSTTEDIGRLTLNAADYLTGAPNISWDDLSSLYRANPDRTFKLKVFYSPSAVAGGGGGFTSPSASIDTLGDNDLGKYTITFQYNQNIQKF